MQEGHLNQICAVIAVLLAIGWVAMLGWRPYFLRNDGVAARLGDWFPRKLEIVAGVASCLLIAGAMITAIYGGKAYVAICLIILAAIGFIPGIVRAFIGK